MVWSLAAPSWCWTSLPPSSPQVGRRRREGNTGCQMTSRSSATTVPANSPPCGVDITAESVGRSSAANAAAALSLASTWDAAAVCGFAASALATSRTTRRKLLVAPVRMRVLVVEVLGLREVFQGVDVVRASTMLHKCPMLPLPHLSKCPEKPQQHCIVVELWKIQAKTQLFLVPLLRRLLS